MAIKLGIANSGVVKLTKAIVLIIVTLMLVNMDDMAACMAVAFSGMLLTIAMADDILGNLVGLIACPSSSLSVGIANGLLMA